MASSQSFILISIIILAIIAILTNVIKNKNTGTKLTPLAGIAFAFVLASILFSENRYLSYCSIGIGVILAIIDIYNKMKKK